MDYGLVLEQGLKQQLSQFQILSLNMLALDNAELEEFLEKEYEENPMMEYVPEKRMKPVSGNSDSQKDEARDYMFQIVHEKSRDIRLYFMEQLNFTDYSMRQWRIISHMISCVSESGLLEVSMDKMARELGVRTSECEECRQQLMRLEPAGVFAMSVQETLKMQLERIGARTPETDEMIDHYLEELGAGHFAKIGKKLGINTNEVREAFDKIKQLNPYPLRSISGTDADFIVPDIICRGVPSDFEVSLNDDWVGNYSLSDYYLNMMAQTKDEELRAYFQKKYERCRFIITSIEKRRDTIQKVSNAVIQRQTEYFFENKPLKPMTMQDIADDVEMNVSTVSRAIKGKYIQYCYGTVLMKSLFCSAAPGENGEDKTAHDIKKEIRRIVDQENKVKPFSDQKIAELLQERDIQISRRTIAKYREEMGIAGTYARKEMASPA